MSYLFVYGTLKKKELADKVLKRDLKETPYTLDGYEKVHVPGKPDDEFSIKENDLEEVKGDLIKVDNEELRLCDYWEDEYTRVQVGQSNNETVDAYIFKGKDK